MNKARKLIIAGNWKMNKTVAEALDLVNGLKRELANVKEIDIVICPPFTALSEVSKAVLNTNLRLGAQNMSENNFGAYTGEVAAGMLKEFSVRYVILGHSERRQYQQESDELIAKKALAAHNASLKPIVCVGETLAEREAGRQHATARQSGRVVGGAGRGNDHRLRTGLGHRHGQDSDVAAGAGSPCVHPQATCGNVQRDRCQTHANPVRWQCQAVERARVDEPGGCGRRAGWWRVAGRPRFFRHREKLPELRERL